MTFSAIAGKVLDPLGLSEPRDWNNQTVSKVITVAFSFVFGFATLGIFHGLYALCSYKKHEEPFTLPEILVKVVIKEQETTGSIKSSQEGESKFGVDEDPLSKRFRVFNDSSCNGCIHGVYITTNEVVTTKEILKESPQVLNSCHIGFSGLHNFDIMAIRESKYGLICDFNPDNKFVIEKALQLIRTAGNRHDFVDQMVLFMEETNTEVRIQHEKGLSKKTMMFYWNYDRAACTEIEQIRAELEREGSWLASDKAFYHIQELAMNDKISAITIDIRNTESFRQIGELCKKESLEIDTLYLSNICEYMQIGEDKEKFVLSVHALLQSDTIVINCPGLCIQDGGSESNLSFRLYQKVRFGKFFVTSEDNDLLFNDADLYVSI